MNTLVFGRTGQLARELMRAAPLSHRRTSLGREAADFTRPDVGGEAVRAVRPDLVVIAAAYTAVDRAETEETLARVVNGEAPARIAQACREMGAAVVHVSTDYVFDRAKAEPYVEADATGPVSAYGRSKLEGEEAVLGSGARAAVVPTAWVYSPFGANFPKTMLTLAEKRDHLRVVSDQVGTPTAAGDLAPAILGLDEGLSRGEPGTDSVFHYAGAGAASWAEFAEAVMTGAAARGRPAVPVIPITTAEYPTPARRPANSRLACERMAALGIAPRPWREALDDVLDELLPG